MWYLLTLIFPNWLKNLLEKYFIFNDDQFLSKGKSGYKYVKELSDELNREGLNIKFELMCRADTIDKEIVGIHRKVQKIKKCFIRVP